MRWVEGYERLAELAPKLPNMKLVYLADREADIAALMRRARDLKTPGDRLVRSKHNRNLDGGTKLWQSVGATESQGELRFMLPARQTQRAREVVQEIWAQTLQMPDGKGDTVPVSCVIAREVNPPAGVTPIEWRLVTSQSVESLEQQASQLIDGYRARWEIEMYFHVLKNGCRIEAL